MKRSSFGYQQLLRTIETALRHDASPRVKAMLRLALRGHEGQHRASPEGHPKLPYIVHPVGVGRLAIELFEHVPASTLELDDAVCAALAHDLLEDTRITADEVERVAGPVVRSLVEALTKAPAHAIGESQDSRNAALVEQIKRAGTPAVFLKACDSMHNLTRPSSTPPTLLKKTVVKAKSHYLPLIGGTPLATQFEEVYRAHIRRAQAVLEGGKQYSPSGTTPDSLEEALEQAAAVSSAKLLELHDVAGLLHLSSAGSHVVIWRQQPGSDVLSVQHAIPEVMRASIETPAGAGLIERSQELPEALARRFAGNRWIEGRTRIITVPMQLDAMNRFLVAVEHIGVDAPAWWTCDVALVLVQFLAHRLIVAATDRRSELAYESAKQGMRFDIDLALTVGVQASHVATWKRWLERCGQAIVVTERCLRRFMAEGRVPEPARSLVRITSRLKAPDSILGKISSSKRHSWPDFERMEDIAGVRVICPSQSCVALVESLLINNATNAGIRLHPGVKSARQDYVNNPTPGGYRAVHIVLEVDSYLPDEGNRRVPCEVQLRTIFQDVWAEIYHAILYRSSHTKRRTHGEAMKQMAEALDHCEELAEQLLERQAGKRT